MTACPFSRRHLLGAFGGVAASSILPWSPLAAAPASGQRVAVIGAGMAGLSTAWFLQEHGLSVTVLERATVAAGASHGNAGWVTPAMVAPLPDPAILREGLRAVALGSGAVHLPLPPGPGLLAFLGGLTRNCTRQRWETGLAALLPLSAHALSAYDDLAAGGVEATTVSAPVVAAYARASQRAPLLAELTAVARAGGSQAPFEVLDGPAVQQAEPLLTGAAQAAVRIGGQRYLDPASFTRALAGSVRRRGGDIIEGTTVTSVRGDGQAAMVTSGPGTGGTGTASTGTSSTTVARYDAAVLATGAWLGQLARGSGVRTRVQSGRGYSFSVPVRQLPAGPVYLPAQRLACTPLPDGRLRVAGVMDFSGPDAAFDPRRVARMASGLRVMLDGAGTAERADEWVGARPCTPDGLPVIGRAGSPRVFAAGGHGMWGITLGPATGRLLARLIATGRAPAELLPFDPLR